MNPWIFTRFNKQLPLFTFKLFTVNCKSYFFTQLITTFFGNKISTSDLKSFIKETIDAHRESASCNMCHKKMDPLGIALENFDVMGRWRDQYTDVSNYTSNKNKGQRFPVDTRTAHMDGRAFEGPQGLKKNLMEDKEIFSRAFIENILSYAMARELTFIDRKNINQLYEQSAKNDFRLRDTPLAIVSAESFTKR